LARLGYAASESQTASNEVCEDAAMFRLLLPRSPIALAFFGYRLWRRLPPAQRRRLLAAAMVHGPALAARARLAGRSFRR
jgi:hypothetical protein